jgi:hypothetical protein
VLGGTKKCVCADLRAIGISVEDRDGERESYAKRSCVDLKRGVMGRAPWCKNYTVSLPLGLGG